MNVLSLFSGIGGLDLGLERAGMTVVGQVEIDPWCRQILAKHWPEVPRHDDVRTAVGWWGGRAVDLVCGGFPCQPVSLAGKGLAQADSRWLWPAFAEVIRDLRPRFALVENVPGLLGPVRVKDGDGRVLGYAPAPVEEVLGDLAALGYDAEWDCVPAAFVGAPHIRNRVFIVAYSNGGRLQVSAQLDSHQAQDPANGHPRREHPDGLRHHVADTASCGRDDPRLNRRGASAGNDPWPTLASEPRGSGRALADSDSPARRPARSPGQEIFRPGTVERSGRCGCGDGHTWPAEPGVGRVAHGIPRRVDRLRGLGNAVVPQVAEHIGRLIMAGANG